MSEQVAVQLGSGLRVNPAHAVALRELGLTIRELQLSPVLAAMKAQQANLKAGYKHLQFNHFQALSKNLAHSSLNLKLPQVAQIVGSLDIKLASAIPLLEVLRNNPFSTAQAEIGRFDGLLLNTFVSLDESRLGRLLDTAAERMGGGPVESVVEVGDFADLETGHAKAVSAEIETELVRTLSGDADARKLSPAAWQTLLTLLNILVVLLGAAADLAGLDTWIKGVQAQTVAADSNAEVRKIIHREVTCADSADALSGYRYVSGDDVFLRDAPGMKAEIIDELPRGVMLEVLGSEGRPWLHVQLTHDGVRLDGFIARRYTKRCIK